ncbi:MAG: cysteine synthase family protein [candidate division Zixibacteria bacterium]|nr:cysteine synthase family protein [candidate division Zixibacteria bacterium]
MHYPNSIAETIGNTPLVRIPLDSNRPGPTLLAKLEYVNPGGSVKDRLAKYVIEKAMADGRLKKGDTVIDNTSGNTGIGLAMIAAAYDLRCILTTAEKTSAEKVDLMKALGAEVIRTPTEASWDDPKSCYQLAKQMAEDNGYFHFNQYHSKENIEAHYETTGREIWEQTKGEITHFVGGIGTGGTVSGAGKFLKEQNPDIKVIAVDPVGSLFTDYIKNGRIIEASTYFVEGIGSDMVTKALEPEYIDEVIQVSDEQSFAMARKITKKYGILAGGSSGTVAYGAYQIARDLGPEHTIVMIFADSAIRYLSKCFSDTWMIKQGFSITEKCEA